MNPALEFRDVHRHFDREVVLAGLTFAVRPGEVFALLGRNGSGKTTAMRILLGLLDAHHGTAEVLGEPSSTLSIETRARIGYVAEDHRLYPEMTVADAIAFDAATRGRFDRARAEADAKRCGLPLDRRVFRLSRGMRAQLALILAIAGDPDVLVFDDPALGLDVHKRRELLETMVDLLSDRGCAVLFSSHVMADVERIADRVGVLHQGALIADAPLDELRTRITRRAFDGDPSALPQDERVLLARARRGGTDVTLLDEDDELLARLRDTGGNVSEPVRLDLEELFLDLTSVPALEEAAR